MKDISIHEYYANLLENQDTKPYTLMKPPEPVGWWKIGADELGNWEPHFLYTQNPPINKFTITTNFLVGLTPKNIYEHFYA